MAPKEKTDNKEDASADSVNSLFAAIFKDPTAVRMLVRYCHMAKVNIDARIIQEISGLSRSTAFAQIKKAKEAEGITEGPKKGTPASDLAAPTKAPKAGTKKRAHGQTTDGEGTNEPSATTKKAKPTTKKGAKPKTLLKSEQGAMSKAAKTESADDVVPSIEDKGDETEDAEEELA